MNEEMRQMLAAMMASQQQAQSGAAKYAGTMMDPNMQALPTAGAGGKGYDGTLMDPNLGALTYGGEGERGGTMMDPNMQTAPEMPQIQLKGLPKAPQMSGQFALPMSPNSELSMQGNVGKGGPGDPVDWGAMLGLNKQF